MSPIDEIIKAHGPFPEGTDLYEMMGVFDAREAGAYPADATNEEITTLWSIRQNGYEGMTIEILRDNRHRALSTLDQAEEQARAYRAEREKQDAGKHHTDHD